MKKKRVTKAQIRTAHANPTELCMREFNMTVKGFHELNPRPDATCCAYSREIFLQWQSLNRPDPNITH